jgi:hypothetical protein
MIQRLETHLFNLPNLLEQENKKYDERVSRFNELTLEQDNFYKVFFSKHQYFYMPYNSIYYEYDGKTYKIVKDDDIHHHLLSTITDEGKLIQWKHKTKLTIVKKIKERSLFKSIPETYTIQNVLGFLQTVFQTKTEAKYFLTIIGDAIFKKQGHLFHFISSKAKGFLQELNNYSQIYIGANILNTFKHKYYDHEYVFCRLINISENIKNDYLWRTFLSNYCIDILCVASHYSIRYNSSDEYMLSNNDSLIDYTFYLKGKHPVMIVDIFLKEYIKPVSTTTSIEQSSSPLSWKNMLYLWKHFLDHQRLPFIVFQQQLKQIIVQKYLTVYNETTDSFTGICSKYMPSIQTFLHFWVNTMELSDNEYDLEIEEIRMLFKRWTSENNMLVNHMNESQLVDLIAHYFPNIEVEDNKYIHKIKNTLWNKKEDIENALELFRNGIEPTNSLSNISFYETYEFYCKHQRSNNSSMIVSKQYFEKYILENMSDYVIDDSFISADWLFA